MGLLGTIRSRYLRPLLNPLDPWNCHRNLHLASISPNSFDISFLSSFSSRPFSVTAQFTNNSQENNPKPLSILFKEVVGLSEDIRSSAVAAEGGIENVKLKEKLKRARRTLNPKVEKSQNRGEPSGVPVREAVGLSEKTESRVAAAERDSKNADLKEKLRKLEEKVRTLNKRRCERCEKDKTMKLHSEKGGLRERNEAKRSLWGLFADKKEVKFIEPTDFGNEDPKVHKELSSDMQTFTHHLYMEGYFKDANFMPKNSFDVNFFEASYAREFLKFAAVKFGKDHQDIAKWLSASDLKKVALFGCPSLGQRSVFAAKHMRKFFKIEEHKVCQKCTLKESCKHANKIPWNDSTTLHLACVTRVLTMYALESVPQQLVVPEEIKDSVSRLWNEIMNLSKTVS